MPAYTGVPEILLNSNDDVTPLAVVIELMGKCPLRKTFFDDVDADSIDFDATPLYLKVNQYLSENDRKNDFDELDLRNASLPKELQSIADKLRVDPQAFFYNTNRALKVFDSLYDLLQYHVKMKNDASPIERQNDTEPAGYTRSAVS